MSPSAAIAASGPANRGRLPAGPLALPSPAGLGFDMAGISDIHTTGSEPDPDGSPEPRRTRRTGSLAAAGPVTWVALAVAALIALALLWSAGEAHYRACVTAVEVRTQGPESDLTRLLRNDAIKHCHRLPL